MPLFCHGAAVFFLFQFGTFEILRTEGLQLALVAMGLPGGTDIAAMQQQPVVGIGNIGLRDMLHQGHLYLIGGVVALAHET